MSFTYAHEAAVAKSLLESEGVFCFLKDELTIQANPFYSNALGGVKLQVSPDDVTKARRLLEEGGYLSGNEPRTITIETATGETAVCPACGCGELSVIRRPSGSLFGLTVLLLGFPITVFSTVYHCYNCGKDIKTRKQKAAG